MTRPSLRYLLYRFPFLQVRAASLCNKLVLVDALRWAAEKRHPCLSVTAALLCSHFAWRLLLYNVGQRLPAALHAYTQHTVESLVFSVALMGISQENVNLFSVPFLTLELKPHFSMLWYHICLLSFAGLSICLPIFRSVSHHQHLYLNSCRTANGTVL